jgi:hypothetical protein
MQCVPIMDRQDEHCPGEGGTPEIRPGQQAEAARLRRRLLAGGVSAAPVLMTVKSRSALAATCLTPSRNFSGNMSSHDDGGGTCPAGHPVSYWQDPSNWTDANRLKPTFQNCTKAPAYTNNSGGTANCSLAEWGPEYTTPPASVADFSFTALVCRKPNDGGPTGGPTTATKRIKLGTSTTWARFGTAFPNSPAISSIVPIWTADSSAPSPSGSAALWELLTYPSGLGGYASLPNKATIEFVRYCIAAYLNATSVQGYPVSLSQLGYMWRDGSNDQYCPLESCSSYWSMQDIMDYLDTTWS